LITQAQVKTDRKAAEALAQLHRHHFLPPEGDIFTPEKRDWWLSQPFTILEKARVQTDWNMLVFANEQVDNLEEIMLDWQPKMSAYRGCCN
jgi:hypothetical protein